MHTPDILLLDLRFQLKFFRGLRETVIAPEQVQQIGVPEEVPYNERVYLISFRLPEVPIEDRCTLEIYAPGGKRLTRFHLALM